MEVLVTVAMITGRLVADENEHSGVRYLLVKEISHVVLHSVWLVYPVHHLNQTNYQQKFINTSIFVRLLDRCVASVSLSIQKIMCNPCFTAVYGFTNKLNWYFFLSVSCTVCMAYVVGFSRNVYTHR